MNGAMAAGCIRQALNQIKQTFIQLLNSSLVCLINAAGMLAASKRIMLNNGLLPLHQFDSGLFLFD